MTNNAWYENNELPPVGCECAFVNPAQSNGFKCESIADGTVVKIVAHHKFGDHWSEMAVFAWVSEDANTQTGHVSVGALGMFSPIG